MTDAIAIKSWGKSSVSKVLIAECGNIIPKRKEKGMVSLCFFRQALNSISSLAANCPGYVKTILPFREKCYNLLICSFI